MRLIPLTQGMSAMVDDEDYQALSAFSWSISSRFSRSAYAIRGHRPGGGIKTTVQMHRQILGASKGQMVDHINHDTLDNRRSNLRIATRSENRRNSLKMPGMTSQYKGVYRSGNRWRAEVTIGKVRAFKASFGSEVEAAIAYDREAIKHFGEYALTNFGSAQPQGGAQDGQSIGSLTA